MCKQIFSKCIWVLTAVLLLGIVVLAAPAVVYAAPGGPGAALYEFGFTKPAPAAPMALLPPVVWNTFAGSSSSDGGYSVVADGNGYIFNR